MLCYSDTNQRLEASTVNAVTVAQPVAHMRIWLRDAFTNRKWKPVGEEHETTWMMLPHPPGQMFGSLLLSQPLMRTAREGSIKNVCKTPPPFNLARKGRGVLRGPCFVLADITFSARLD